MDAHDNCVDKRAAVGGVRSLLIAPAVRPDFVAKLPTRGADAVLIDCEDSVPAQAKSQARQTVQELLPELLEKGCRVLVRVNAEPSEWFDQDLSDALSKDLSAVVVPKLESVEQADRVAAGLAAVGLSELSVMAGIETAMGVANARQLLAHQSIAAAYFGAEDFIADMGGVRTVGNAEVAYARSACALAARLAGVPIFDQVVTEFANEERFTTEAVQARNLGYAGKLCIHPAQVALANAAFTPSEQEVERAKRLLAAYREAQERGVAAIDFEGQMVDEPLAAQAAEVIARSDVVGTESGDSR